MRAFEQAWSVLKADPLAQGGMGTLPPAVRSMIERQRAGNVGDFSQIAAANRARQLENIRTMTNPNLTMFPNAEVARANALEMMGQTARNIKMGRGEDTQELPPFIDFSGATRQGYPTVMQDISPITGGTTMATMGGRGQEATVPVTMRNKITGETTIVNTMPGQSMANLPDHMEIVSTGQPQMPPVASIPITETMPEEAFMAQPESRMARRGVGAARRRMESGARGPTGQGMTPYRTKEGMLASNVGVASPTRLRRDTRPVETQQERTGKPTVAQNTADILAQFAQQQSTEFDRPAEVDLKPEPKSGGINEQIDTAGRGGRRALRTRQSIAGQDDRPNFPIRGFERGSQPPVPMRGLPPVDPQRLQQSIDMGRADPDLMNEERLLELARQLGKQNGAQQTAVDRTA